MKRDKRINGLKTTSDAQGSNYQTVFFFSKCHPQGHKIKPDTTKNATSVKPTKVGSMFRRKNFQTDCIFFSFIYVTACRKESVFNVFSLCYKKLASVKSPWSSWRHACHHLRTVSPKYPFYIGQIDFSVAAPCGLYLPVCCLFPLFPCSLVYHPFHISLRQEFSDLPPYKWIDNKFRRPTVIPIV